MTLTELEQIKFKKREIELIEDKISLICANTTSDTVTGSMPSLPWTKHTIAITGFDESDISRASRRIDKLRQQKHSLEREVELAEEFVAGLSDSRVRMIIELKYIRGLTWNMAASKVFDYPCGDRARKVVNSFFKNS